MITIQQLEYIVAIDTYRHFVTASVQCHVTQPTLSMQLKKLENELGTIIFDRSRQPIVPTEVGQEVIDQARKILSELREIPNLVKAKQGTVEGTLRIAVIPTLAPYLLPWFIGNFAKAYPKLEVTVQELKTEHLLRALRKNLIDVGIMVTPWAEEGLVSEVLFYEKFLGYCHPQEAAQYGNSLEVADLVNHKLWLMSEGNCFRDQTFNLCALNHVENKNLRFQYESGSIEALMRMVDHEGGITLIPELASLDLSEEKIDRTKFLGHPNPVREVSLIVNKHYPRQRLVSVLKEHIIDSLPEQLRENRKERVVDVQ